MNAIFREADVLIIKMMPVIGHDRHISRGMQRTKQQHGVALVPYAAEFHQKQQQRKRYPDRTDV